MSEYATNSVAKGNCVAAKRGGEQPEANGRSVGKRSVRRKTNPIRRCVSGEPARVGRSLELIDPARVAAKARVGRTTWLGAEREEGGTQETGRPAPAGEPVQESEPS